MVQVEPASFIADWKIQKNIKFKQRCKWVILIASPCSHKSNSSNATSINQLIAGVKFLWIGWIWTGLYFDIFVSLPETVLKSIVHIVYSMWCTVFISCHCLKKNAPLVLTRWLFNLRELSLILLTWAVPKSNT